MRARSSKNGAQFPKHQQRPNNQCNKKLYNACQSDTDTDGSSSKN